MQKLTKSELVLEFCVELSRRMIVSGANLERVQLAIERICHAYGLTDVSVFLLSNNVSLSAMDAEGRYAARQCAIPPAGIHLERLKKLNRLSYTVVSEKPAPERLRRLLNEASQTKEYPDWAVLLAQLCAMSCLCLIFGGGAREVLSVPLIPGDLFYYSLVGLYLGDTRMASANALNCLLTLLGMSIGFVLSSIIAHYIRKVRHTKLIKHKKE